LNSQEAIYDKIGTNYQTTRIADSRIVEELIRLLGKPPGGVICDIGAGSGNYTIALADRGYRLIAVEPSATMLLQAKPHEYIEWRKGSAEELPISTANVAAVICTLAAHHFADIQRVAIELQRVAPSGPWIFFTMDPRLGQKQWFGDYFPEILQRDHVIFPSVDTIADLFKNKTYRECEITPFSLPPDLADEFMFAPWARPERYLDAQFRANTSGFALADPSHVARGLIRLSSDLESGRWDKEYGHFRHQKLNDAGFCFLRFAPKK
jgi:ubiquinone/menaquinone biosynthesis C-methylase UbiE